MNVWKTGQMKRVSILASVVLGMALTMHTAPASATEPDSSSESSDEDDGRRGDELAGQARRAQGIGDYKKAIELWEAAYIEYPAGDKEWICLDLALAHWNYFKLQSKDDQARYRGRLVFAKETYLDRCHIKTRLGVGAEDVKEREEAQALLREINEALDALDRDSRPQLPGPGPIPPTPTPTPEDPDEVDQEQHRAKAHKIHRSVGGALVGLGVASMGTMTAYLALGRRVDRRGEQLAQTPTTPARTFDDLRDDGTRYNRLAVVTGVVGGALVVSGTAVLIHGTVKHGRSRRPKDSGPPAARIRPLVGGLEVKF